MEQFTPVIAALSDIFSNTLLSVLVMAFGFGLMILVHEAGHFLVAKWVGIRVEEFAIGFGRRIWSFRRGETEYRLNLIPLGGYVKMLGQDDFKTKQQEESDPRAYSSKPIWARICVVSAGVVMNVLLAVILFIVIFMIGIRFTAPVVGGVSEGFPAAAVKLPGDRGVGLQPGDRVLAINGSPVYKFETLAIEATLSKPDQQFLMTIGRPTNGDLDVFDVSVGTKGQQAETGATRYVFGIIPPADRVIYDGDIPGYLSDEVLQPDDVIVEVDGREIIHGWDLAQLHRNLDGSPVQLTINRLQDGEISRKLVYIAPHLSWSDSFFADFAANADENSVQDSEIATFNVLGLQPRMRILTVAPETPASEADVRPGDLILGYGDPPQIPTVQKMREISKSYVNRHAPIYIQREGKQLDPAKVRVASRNGSALIGITSIHDDDNLVIADTLATSPFHDRIESGARITAVNDLPVSTWPQLIDALAQLQQQEIVLSYVGPDGIPGQTDPLLLTKDLFKRDHYSYDLILPLKPLRGEIVKTYNPFQAALWGTRETGGFIVQVYATLRSMFQGRVSAKELSGPVGIFRHGVAAGERGVVWLLYLLAMISANLAVINFLPLPIVDGGHVVLLVAEKIRRKPLSVPVQNVIQIAGLVLIVMLFVLITYNDIAQWVGSRW